MRSIKGFLGAPLLAFEAEVADLVGGWMGGPSPFACALLVGVGSWAGAETERCEVDASSLPLDEACRWLPLLLLLSPPCCCCCRPLSSGSSPIASLKLLDRASTLKGDSGGIPGRERALLLLLVMLSSCCPCSCPCMGLSALLLLLPRGGYAVEGWAAVDCGAAAADPGAPPKLGREGDAAAIWASQ